MGRKKKGQQGPKGLTPYQGDKQSFGAYTCENCRRTWMSAYSWANCAQYCRLCGAKVYPHVQRPLKDPGSLDKIDEKKEHESALCEKCQQLGRNCRSFSPKKRKRNRSRKSQLRQAS